MGVHPGFVLCTPSWPPLHLPCPPPTPDILSFSAPLSSRSLAPWNLCLWPFNEKDFSTDQLPPSHCHRLKNSLCSKGMMPSLSVKTQEDGGYLRPFFIFECTYGQTSQWVTFVRGPPLRRGSLPDENQSPFVISHHGSLAQLTVTVYTVTMPIF